MAKALCAAGALLAFDNLGGFIGVRTAAGVAPQDVAIAPRGNGSGKKAKLSKSFRICG